MYLQPCLSYEILLDFRKLCKEKEMKEETYAYCLFGY